MSKESEQPLDPRTVIVLTVQEVLRDVDKAILTAVESRLVAALSNLKHLLGSYGMSGTRPVQPQAIAMMKLALHLDAYDNNRTGGRPFRINDPKVENVVREWIVPTLPTSLLALLYDCAPQMYGCIVNKWQPDTEQIIDISHLYTED